MNQINNSFKLLESFYFIFHVDKSNKEIQRTFSKLIQADKGTMLIELTNLNNYNSDSGIITIQEYKITNKLHFDYMYKPKTELYPLLNYYESFHLIDKL